MADSPPAAAMLKTPLHSLHVELGAKMVPFAGYDMPVSYPAGIMAEHRQCREAARCRRRMGQVRLVGATPRPRSRAGAGRRRQSRRGTALRAHHDAGGILDDLMVTRRADHLFSSSTPAARPPTSRTCARRSRRAAASSRCPTTRCLRCRGRPRQPSSAASHRRYRGSPS
jgi:glycine cleavage system aminomethyltransferase T